MNWYLKHIVAVNQQILNLLKQKQVSQEVIQFIQSLPDNQAGKYISTLMRNPNLSLQDLRNIGKPKEDQQLLFVAKEFGIQPNILLDYVKSSDPTPHLEYKTWILGKIKEQKVRLPEDMHRVKEALQKFHRLKNNPNYHFEKNIHSYKRLSDLEEVLENISGTGSRSQGYLQVNPLSLPGVFLEGKTENYILYRVNDSDSLAEMGEGTKWCTRKSYPDCQADFYLGQYGDIYIITDKSGKLLYQYTPDFEQFMDAKDNYVSNLDAELQSLVKPNIQEQGLDTVLNFAIKVKKKPWKEAEPLIATNAKAVYEYATDLLNRRWPEAEHVLLENKELALSYVARFVFKWPELEKQIIDSGDAAKAYSYAVSTNGIQRWPEGEKLILQEPIYIYNYAREVIRRRWDKGEEALLQMPSKKSSQHAIQYLSDFRRFFPDREWYELRNKIYEERDFNNLYAYIVYSGRRFPEAEADIAAIPKFAAFYADQILKEPWPEAEPAIAESGMDSYRYASNVIKGRWEPGEEAILRSTPDIIYNYTFNVLNERWPEAEEQIKKIPHIAFRYATDILQRPWPEAENWMKQSASIWSRYKEHFNIKDRGWLPIF